jgi:putative DNA primase/helicase
MSGVAVEVSAAKERERAARIAQVEALLEGAKIPDGNEVRVGGVYVEGTRVSKRPFLVSATICDPDGGGHSLLVRALNHAWKPIAFEITYELIHGAPSRLATVLSEKGLKIDYGKAKEIAEYLNRTNARQTLVRVRQIGWVGEAAKDLVFALRDRVLGGEGYDLSRLQENELLKGMVARGSLKAWQKTVAAPAEKHPVLIAAACVMFASVLTPLLGEETFGIHIKGESSTGKTTAGALAQSIWGRAYRCGDGPSMMLSFNATSNAIESWCETRNHVGMLLDEIGMHPGQDFPAFIYRLSNCTRKGRLGREGNLRESNYWSFCYLTTGELSVEEMLSADDKGGRVREGQTVRLINIETAGRIIIAESKEEAKETAIQFHGAISDAYGTAGPAFIDALIDALRSGELDREELIREWNEIAATYAIASATPAQQRAIRHLAFLALGGSLACVLGILPFEEETVVAALKTVRDMYLASEPLSDGARAARRLRDHISERCDRAVSIGSESNWGRGQSLMKWKVCGAYHYLFTTEQLRKAAGVHDVKPLLKFLHECGLLHQNNGTKLQAKVPAFGESKSQRSMYAIHESLLEWADETAKPPNPKKSDEAANSRKFKVYTRKSA